MPPEAQISSIAYVIQMAVAPVFLLTGVGAILSVLTNRLARIIDRTRKLEDEERSGGPSLETHQRVLLAALRRRSHLVNQSITFCTTCALLICVVIMALFVGAITNLDLSTLIAVLFIAAMAVLIAGLICFLREIYIATESMRMGGADR